MNDINPRYPAVIQSALRFLDGKGLARVQSAPLLHRLLWRAGIALPPPILAGFGTNALVQGLLFGLFWTALMWLMLWQGSERPLALLLVAGLLAGPVRCGDGGADALAAPPPQAAGLAAVPGAASGLSRWRTAP